MGTWSWLAYQSGVRAHHRDQPVAAFGGKPGACVVALHKDTGKVVHDIKVFDIFEGTGQIQRIVISKRILKEPPSF